MSRFCSPWADRTAPPSLPHSEQISAAEGAADEKSKRFLPTEFDVN
jgi:hypothetical protein